VAAHGGRSSFGVLFHNRGKNHLMLGADKAHPLILPDG
jgi:hypothetical protein